MTKEEKTKQALFEFDEARCALDLLKSEIHVAKQGVIPPEVQNALDDIDAEFEDVLKLASSQMDEKKKLASAAIVELGESYKISGRASGTFVRGSITVNSKMRDEFMKRIEADPILKSLFNFGKNYARIK